MVTSISWLALGSVIGFYFGAFNDGVDSLLAITGSEDFESMVLREASFSTDR